MKSRTTLVLVLVALVFGGLVALDRYKGTSTEDAQSKRKRVLDFAAGSGLAAIAAAKAGAASVAAADIDRFAVAAIGLNADLNAVGLETIEADILGQSGGWEVVLAGDVCYERPMAERVGQWFGRLADGGTRVLMGDPGRNYLPATGLSEVARYQVPTSLDLEDRISRETIVWLWKAEA